MTTTIEQDESEEIKVQKPGAMLAEIRDNKGLSKEYVAGKLHLRVKVIELLEADDYYNMPEPVFIKGYFRAYARLLEENPEPIVEHFNRLFKVEHKPERALWQSKKESHYVEHAIRWVTAGFAVVVIVAVALWWHKNKDNEKIFSDSSAQLSKLPQEKTESEVKLTDLTKMRSLLSTNSKN